MPTILIKNADHLVTMNPIREEFINADVFIRDGVIEAIGHNLAREADEIVYGQNCVVTPGLVNTHHHLYQSLTKAVPNGQDAL